MKLYRKSYLNRIFQLNPQLHFKFYKPLNPGQAGRTINCSKILKLTTNTINFKRRDKSNTKINMILLLPNTNFPSKIVQIITEIVYNHPNINKVINIIFPRITTKLIISEHENVIINKVKNSFDKTEEKALYWTI